MQECGQKNSHDSYLYSDTLSYTPVIIFLFLFIHIIKIGYMPTLGHTFSLFFPRKMNTFK